jgi:hypothetical protein
LTDQERLVRNEKAGFESPYLHTLLHKWLGINKMALAKRAAHQMALVTECRGVLVTSVSVSAEIRDSSRGILMQFHPGRFCGAKQYRRSRDGSGLNLEPAKSEGC